MIANLKTHRVYPEIITNPITGQWVGKLIDVQGKVKATYNGQMQQKRHMLNLI